MILLITSPLVVTSIYLYNNGVTAVLTVLTLHSGIIGVFCGIIGVVLTIVGLFTKVFKEIFHSFFDPDKLRKTLKEDES